MAALSQQPVEVPAAGISFDLPAAVPGRAEFLAAWEAEDGEKACSHAYGLVQTLVVTGQLNLAADLLEQVTARFEGAWATPLLLAVLGDIKRSQGEFEEAFEHLERADALATEDELIYHLMARSRSAGARGQAFLDLGLLKQAQLTFQQIREHDAALTAVLRGRGALRAAAQIDLGTEYYRYNVDLGLGLNTLAEQGARTLLDGDALREVPEQRGRVQVMLGMALLERARDTLAYPESAETSELLGRARAELEGALGAGALSFEERFKAQVALVDVFWLSHDAPRERAILRALYEADDPQVEPAWLGDRAAYRVRRLLLDAEQRAPLMSALDSLVAGLAESIGAACGLPGPAEGGPASIRAWRTLRAGVERAYLTEARAELEAVFAEVRAAWMGAPRLGEGLGFLHWDEQLLLVGTWMRVLIELHGPERGAELALEAVSNVHSMGTLARRVAADTTASEDGWRTWRAALPKGRGVLVLLPSADSTHLLAFDASRVTHAEVPASRATLERLARSVAGYVRRPPGSVAAAIEARAREDAQALGEALLVPSIRERLRSWRAVTIVGSELLGDPCLEWVPFDGHLFGERFGTSYVPSLDLAQVLESRCEARGFDPQELVVIAANGEPCPRPVDLTPAEMVQLRDSAKGGLRVGSHARLDGPLGEGILAVVAHGEYLAHELRPAHLVLAEGPVGCEALERAQLPPLVCLLACDAARGPILPGDDGALHLGGAALVGGAGTVLLARNDVETAASLALFELFTAQVRDGVSPDEALRRARTALPELREEWRHPFFTQSFSLFGLGRLPVR